MGLVARLVCLFLPRRCHRVPGGPPVVATASPTPPPLDSTADVIHRSAQVETSMKLQAGLMRRQAARLADALRDEDDETIAQVTRSMLHPERRLMWMEAALTPPPRGDRS